MEWQGLKGAKVYEREGVISPSFGLEAAKRSI